MADIIARAVDNASAVERAVADLETARARADSAYTVYAPYVALSGPTAGSLKKNSQS